MNDIKWYLEQTKDWTLQVLHEDNWVKSYCLRKYEDRTIMATVLHFFSNQIVISGDVTPTRRVTTGSDYGYGLEWFAGHLDADYLAEKFLTQRWVKELAVEYWKEQLAQFKDEYASIREEMENEPAEERPAMDFPYNKVDWHVAGERLDKVTIIEAFEKMVERLENDPDIDARWIYENQPAYWSERGGRKGFEVYQDGSDGFGGYGYDPNEAGWLYAIQHRFAECYKEMKGGA